MMVERHGRQGALRQKESQIRPFPGSMKLGSSSSLALNARQRQMVESKIIVQQTRRSLRPHHADQVSSFSTLMATMNIPGHTPTPHQQHSAGISTESQSVRLIGKPHLGTPNADTTEGSREYVLALVHVQGSGCLPLHHSSMSH